MSSRYRYRNPPSPLGYMKREIGTVFKRESEEEDAFIDNLCEEIKASGILQGPELSIYKTWINTVAFNINPSSEEEEEKEDD